VALSGCGCGTGGSIVAVIPPHVATSTAIVMAAAVDGFTLFIDSFGFFGGMISSSNNHGGRQCGSRPKPSNTESPQGLTGM
jgi:hypothetical protein